MKKLIYIISAIVVCLLCSTFVYEYVRVGNKNKEDLEYKGEYILSDSTEVFTFVNDSLYIDCYNSGCGIDSYKLTKDSLKQNLWYGKCIDFETNIERIDTIEIKETDTNNCLLVKINKDEYKIEKK